jgi:small-conductance mechanosensitive channel
MPGTWFLYAYLCTKYTIGFEQLLSGILLILAVVLIRKFLIEHGMESQVNYKKLGYQVLLYLFYCISIVIFYYYLAVQMTTADCSTDRNALRWWIVTTFMNFFV